VKVKLKLQVPMS